MKVRERYREREIEAEDYQLLVRSLNGHDDQSPSRTHMARPEETVPAGQALQNSQAAGEARGSRQGLAWLFLSHHKPTVEEPPQKPC